MKKETLVCPKCKHQFEQPEKLNAPAQSGDDDDGKHGVDCDPDDPGKKAYCCPMCGYKGPDPGAFVALS